MTINWDVIKKVAITLPAGLTIISTFLSALGINPIQVGQITGALLAAAALLVWLIDTIRSSQAQTDAGKASTIASLDANGTRAVIANLPDPIKQQVADAMPAAVKVEAVNKDPTLPNV